MDFSVFSRKYLVTNPPMLCATTLTRLAAMPATAASDKTLASLSANCC